MNVESRLKTALDESRLLIGAQVLFGFPFEAALQKRNIGQRHRTGTFQARSGLARQSPGGGTTATGPDRCHGRRIPQLPRPEKRP